MTGGVVMRAQISEMKIWNKQKYTYVIHKTCFKELVLVVLVML